MGSIRFKTIDAEFLYSFPKTANDLRTIVWAYTFINRTGPPTYEELTSCLTKKLSEKQYSYNFLYLNGA